MKATTALILGAGALAVVFIWSRSKSTAALAPGAKPSTTTANLLSLLGGGLGGAAVQFFSPSASSPTSTNTTSSVAQQNNADYSQASNYIADSTATSDSSSGVVGFGGWDD